MEYSPALSVDVDLDDMTDEQLELHFANYAPLSNLPTPDPSKDFSSLVANFSKSHVASEVLHPVPELEVYATQLSKLVPSNVSISRPSVPTIQGFLERAKLETEVIAFAACILDALSQRFARPWRAACLLPNPPNVILDLRRQQSTGPEVIVFAALAIAHGFLSDFDRTSKHWTRIEGGALFTVREFEASKRCILQDIDYGLTQISEKMVNSMLRLMQRAAGNISIPRALVPAAPKPCLVPAEKERKPIFHIDLHLGTAVWNYGMQTPEPSP